MSLTVRCECGKVYVLGDDAAGKQFRCQACGRTVDVSGQQDLGSTRVDAPALPPGFDPGLAPTAPSRPETAAPGRTETAAPGRAAPAAPVGLPAGSTPARVVVVDFDMSFGSMVWFMVKLAVATIPAAMILTVLVWVVTALLVMLAGPSR